MIENDQREAIKRILHDFVMLKLTGDTTIKQVVVLLDTTTNKVYRLFEDDITQYHIMLKEMEGSGYASGPGGLASLIQDVRRMNKGFKAIREALNDAQVPHSIGSIAQHVVKLVEENQAHQRERFDFLEYGRMCEALEDAGFGPDADGIKSLIRRHKDAHVALVRIKDQAEEGLK